MHGWILVGTHLAAAIAGGLLYRIYGSAAIAKVKADLAEAHAELAKWRGTAAGFIGGSPAQAAKTKS